jgi:hypothetical protein
LAIYSRYDEIYKALLKATTIKGSETPIKTIMSSYKYSDNCKSVAIGMGVHDDSDTIFYSPCDCSSCKPVKVVKRFKNAL